jgi:hypothetical protein
MLALQPNGEVVVADATPAHARLKSPIAIAVAMFLRQIPSALIASLTFP